MLANTIHRLLRQTREIYDQKTAPEGREGCRDCEALDRLLRRREQLGVTLGTDGTYDIRMYLDSNGRRRLFTESRPRAGFIASADELEDWFSEWVDARV